MNVPELSTAERVIKEIASENSEVEVFYFTSLVLKEQVPRAQRIEKLPDEWWNAAREMKDETGMGFWQCIMGLHPDSLVGGQVDPGDVAYHHGVGGVWNDIRKDALVREGTAALPTSGQGVILNFVSKVLCRNGEVAYVPIIDFRIKQSDEAKNIVETMLSYLESETEVPFKFCKSASSYHAYGMRVVSFGCYMEILGRALLFDPVVDGRHIGHQMIDGFGALRVG